MPPVKGVGSASADITSRVAEFRRLSPDLQDQAIYGLQQTSPAEAERLASASGYAGPALNTRQSITLPSAKSGPATAPPRGKKLSPKAEKAYHAMHPQADVTCEIGGKVKTLSGDKLTRQLEKMRSSDPAAHKKFLADNNMKLTDGVYRVPGSAVRVVSTGKGGGAGGRSSGGSASTGAGLSSISPWAAGGLGLLGGGAVGAFTAYNGAKTYNSIASASNGVSAGGGAGGGSALASTAAAIATAAGVSTDGLQFRLRAQMSSVAREARHDSMIGMFNSGMPIEDLIFMFLMHMSETYEDKLKEKMEEAMIAEKLQERQQRRTEQANQAAGMIEAAGAAAGSIPFYGAFVQAGAAASAGVVRQAASSLNQVEAGLNGGMKSGTTLANEVQMLMHKWKAMTELASNLIKAMHDMQMTPIRNIR